MPQACPHLAVPFAGERRRFQDAPNVVYQLVIRTGPNGSPAGARRSRRNTTSVFCRAENRSGFFPPLLLPSPVALRAPCEGTSMEISCACIWTPPVSDYTQCGVQSNCTPNHFRHHLLNSGLRCLFV